MRQYLLDTFSYNDSTNRKLLEKIKQLPDKSECIKLFSHLINSQYKWMARIKQDPAAKTMCWWDPIYEFENLEEEWTQSLKIWLDYVNEMTEDDLSKDVVFVGYDGALWTAAPLHIALQLNYHSIHHRAQIQTVIRSQGFEPDFVDYIGTKYRRIG